MISLLKQYLSNNNHSLALSLLTHPKFYHQIFQSQIIDLIKIVQSSNNKYSSSIMVAIYAIIIIKPHNILYNQKLATQILTRIYRQNKLIYKEVIAGLLIRLPNFSNHRLIVNSIHSKYINKQLMLEHTCQLNRQCKKQWEQKWEQEKDKWVECSKISQKQLGDQVQIYKNYIIKLINKELSNGEQLKITMNKIEKQFRYLLLRISIVQKQTINIDKIIKCIDQVINIKVHSQNQFLLSSVINKKIIQYQNMTLKITAKLILHCKRRMLRKIKWIHDLIINGLSQRQLAMDLNQYLILLKIYIKLFGIFSLSINDVLFNNEWSIIKIIQILCNHKFQISKKQEINYQKSKKNKNNNQGKNKQQLVLTILNNNVNHYQKYLKSLNQWSRNKIFQNCLQIFISYYETGIYFKASNLLQIIDNAKNRLNQSNMNIYQKLKSVLFPQYIEIKPGFQYFCQQVFNNKIRNRIQNIKNKKLLSISQLTSISIIPTISRQINSIKKTKSYQFQGWDKDEGDKMKSGILENSQMFYSIKQCSQDIQSNFNKNNKKNYNQTIEDEGILTPQF